MRIFFIDGYNVINSWKDLRDIKDYSYESARNSLIEKVLNYASFKGYIVHIVFDAHLQEGSLEKHENYGTLVEVVFTKTGETADSYIEKSVNSIGRIYDVVVVSSDSLVQQVIFQRGAARMSSTEFNIEVNSAKGTMNKNKNLHKSKEGSLFVERINEDVLEKLEKIRKGD